MTHTKSNVIVVDHNDWSFEMPCCTYNEDSDGNTSVNGDLDKFDIKDLIDFIENKGYKVVLTEDYFGFLRKL